MFGGVVDAIRLLMAREIVNFSQRPPDPSNPDERDAGAILGLGYRAATPLWSQTTYIMDKFYSPDRTDPDFTEQVTLHELFHGMGQGSEIDGPNYPANFEKIRQNCPKNPNIETQISSVPDTAKIE
jgi:hypothetical protein